jgi:hypothetical protein
MTKEQDRTEEAKDETPSIKLTFQRQRRGSGSYGSHLESKELENLHRKHLRLQKRNVTKDEQTIRSKHHWSAQ